MAKGSAGPEDLTKLVRETLEKHGLDPRIGYELIQIAMAVHPEDRLEAVHGVLEEEASRT